MFSHFPRKIPQYHDCGSTSQVEWSPRPAGADTGFFIQFNGGDEDRRSDIEFICDMSAGNIFSFGLVACFFAFIHLFVLLLLIVVLDKVNPLSPLLRRWNTASCNSSRAANPLLSPSMEECLCLSNQQLPQRHPSMLPVLPPGVSMIHHNAKYGSRHGSNRLNGVVKNTCNVLPQVCPPSVGKYQLTSNSTVYS